MNAWRTGRPGGGGVTQDSGVRRWGMGLDTFEPTSQLAGGCCNPDIQLDPGLGLRGRPVSVALLGILFDSLLPTLASQMLVVSQ